MNPQLENTIKKNECKVLDLKILKFKSKYMTCSINSSIKNLHIFTMDNYRVG